MIKFYSTKPDNIVIPKVLYLNADLDKENIIKDNKGKSGVYRWTNKLNGKSYIGSSIDLSKRFIIYYNYKKISNNQNMNINKSLLKYGYSNFSLEILEYCEENDCIQREQHYLDLLNPEYNILKNAGSSLGFKHSEETLLKLKNRKRKEFTEEEKLEFVERMAKAREERKMKGITFKHSEETKLKLSEKRKGSVHSEETKVKMVGNKGIKVLVTNIITNEETEFVSLRQAAAFMDTSLDTVRRYLNDQKILKNTFKIEKR